MAWIRGDLLWIRQGRETSGLVLVTRKALGTAVCRNRLKRRLRHIYRECGTIDGCLVVLSRPACVASSFAVLREEYSCLVSRLRSSLPR